MLVGKWYPNNNSTTGPSRPTEEKVFYWEIVEVVGFYDIK